jgi:hypothetical protein
MFGLLRSGPTYQIFKECRCKMLMEMEAKMMLRFDESSDAYWWLVQVHQCV